MPRRVMPTFGLLALAFVASGVICAGGCVHRDAGPTTAPITPGENADLSDQAWWPSPAAARVFPSTRFVREAGDTFLEARIELLDSMGDPVKWPGVAGFQLLAARSETPLQTGGTLYQWRVAVLADAQQRLHYDPVTRTYLFRLLVDDAEVVARPTALRVEFTPPDGDRLTDTAAIAGPTWR